MTDLNGVKIILKGRRANKLTYGNVENSTISTFDGNDALTITTLLNSVINLGNQNDKIDVTDVKNSTINGGNGIDQVTILYSINSTYNLGTGNDIFLLTGKMNLSGYGNLIDGGAGSDILKLPNFQAAMTVGYENGSFILYDFGQTKLKNFEKIEVSGGVSMLLQSNGTITINGTSGDDQLSTLSNAVMNCSINAGDGNDVINASVVGQATIDGGNGADRINIKDDVRIAVQDGNWSLGSNDVNKAYLKNIESVAFGNEVDGFMLYQLASTGAKITSTRELGGFFKGSSGIDTIIGSSKNDLFYVYGDKVGNKGVDLFDFSAGGKDSLFFDPTSYSSGTTPTSPIVMASVFGSSKEDIYDTIYSVAPKVVSDTRTYDSKGFAISGALKLTSQYAAGLTFQIDFIATKPV